jgi:glutamate---cysteine ligase / carboxylate-amine ligase
VSKKYHLFERFGVELEYMIVDETTLDVRPITDQVLHAVAGAYESEVDRGPLSWSNELVLHVIELKTNGPAEALDGLAARFQHDVQQINDILAGHGALLMPTAMHPWMNPHSETRLWPHEYCPVYEAFDRIFNCKGHGWSNLQSTHINLPFADDEEFGRLHAAIRLVLPILPALAASSPMMDGRLTGMADSRLEVYRHNARRVPSVSGRVIPEAVFTRRDYERHILQRIYDDLAPFDAEGVLRDEWVNARGAIARFSRSTIEIRVLDIQECPAADLAVMMLIVAVLRGLVEERWSRCEEQREWSIDSLERILLQAINLGDRAVIDDGRYLRMFGLERSENASAGALWGHLFDQVFAPSERSSAALSPLRTILQEGSLSRRLVSTLGEAPDRARIVEVYRELCACLAQGRMFHG